MSEPMNYLDLSTLDQETAQLVFSLVTSRTTFPKPIILYLGNHQYDLTATLPSLTFQGGTPETNRAAFPNDVEEAKVRHFTSVPSTEYVDHYAAMTSRGWKLSDVSVHIALDGTTHYGITWTNK